MSSKRAKSLLSSLPSEMSVYFGIHTETQDIIEANAEERFGLDYGDADLRAEMMEIGMVDGEGKITQGGWNQLVKDSLKLEENSMAWLRKTFESARDDGHDRYDDLVGEVWFDPRDADQVEEIYIGLTERIDMSDSSYGSLASIVWKGVSGFGQNVLGGAINFEKGGRDDRDIKDEVEKLLDHHKRSGLSGASQSNLRRKKR